MAQISEKTAGGAPETGEKGLKKGAIGFMDALVIGIASTAPAYSLAAVIGLIVVTVGVQSPAVLFASFVPMFFIATAFYYMNRADQDCGTTFSWVTRAMGPWAGWMGGWAICVTGILVIGSLADVAARYTYLLFSLDGLAASKPAITLLAVVYMIVMTAVCVIGIELSAKVQNVMIVAQVVTLLVFAGVALYLVFSGSSATSLSPELSWFNPFAIQDSSALIGGLLIGVFIYWGWESSVNLTEETTDSSSTPGLAAVFSTVILLATYLSVAVAVVAFAGLGTVTEFADDDAILSTVATGVLGSPWYLLVVVSVLTSALASTQTTILPASRTTLSMARAGAFPRVMGKVHPRFLTPHVSTMAIGILAIIWYVPINLVSENFLFDTLSALSLMIAFYYALTGFACAIYYRKELTKSVKNFLFIGLAPVLGASLLAYLFFVSIVDLSDPGASYTGGSFLGIGMPLVIGLGFLLLGVVFMVLWRVTGGGHEEFFGRKPETVPPEVASGEVKVTETAGAPPEAPKKRR
ncbi:APC family permease [Rubrobacter indicoceani]|uniref:APC family permease n=1 Tax=Rubrobacter indicoceani TaxID=2051957 RepID=UPI000E5B371B|nr:APC family permease [Rubrobacter indicoceani]